jgi:hypothetical protein
VVERPESPVFGVDKVVGRLRLLAARPDDGRPGPPLAGVGKAPGVPAATGGRLGFGGALPAGCGVVCGDEAAAAVVVGVGGGLEAVGDAAPDVFRGDGVRKSRRFLGLEGVSSLEGDKACGPAATSAVGDTGEAAADGGVASRGGTAGPGGDGLDDSVDVVGTSGKDCCGVDC